MSERNYLGLNVQILQPTQHFAKPFGTQRIYQIASLRKMEAQIWRVPKFSKLVAKHIHARLAQPRRQLLTKQFTKHLDIMPLAMYVGQNILPVSVYVPIVNLMNRTLIKNIRNCPLPRLKTFQRFACRMDRQHPNAFRWYFSRTEAELNAFYASLANRHTNCYPMQPGYAEQAAKIIHDEYDFRPYWASCNGSYIVVLTDDVYRLLNFFIDLACACHRIGLDHSRNVRSPQAFRDGLSDIQHRCPKQLARNRSLIIRQLKYTVHDAYRVRR